MVSRLERNGDGAALASASRNRPDVRPTDRRSARRRRAAMPASTVPGRPGQIRAAKRFALDAAYHRRRAGSDEWRRRRRPSIRSLRAAKRDSTVISRGRMGLSFVAIGLGHSGYARIAASIMADLVATAGPVRRIRSSLASASGDSLVATVVRWGRPPGFGPRRPPGGFAAALGTSAAGGGALVDSLAAFGACGIDLPPVFRYARGCVVFATVGTPEIG